MSPNKSVPDAHRPTITPLPARLPNMSRREQQKQFEQVKVQVADTANKYFDHTLRIIKRWMEEESESEPNDRT